MRTAPGWIVIAVVAASSPAGAQTELRVPAPPAPVEGEYEGAESVLWNPALLADAAAWQLAYVHHEQSEGSALGSGSQGEAFFFASPVFGSLALGAGVAIGYPGDGFDPDGNASDRRWGMISLGAALRPVASLSLGILYRGYLADADAGIDGFSTVDLGLAFRPWRFFGVSFAVADLALPAPDTPAYSPGQPLSAFERRYLADVAVRPLGDDFLTLGASIRAGETSGRIWLGAGVAVRPLEGLTLRGRFDARMDGCADDDCFADWQVGTAIEVAFPFSAVGGGLGLYQGDAAVDGFDVVARISGSERPAVARGDRVIGLRMSGSADAVDRLALASRFESIRRDDDVVGVLLELDGFEGSIPSVQEIRRHVAALRSAGKTVWCCYDDAGGGAAYLCRSAERTFVSPGGGARFTGIRTRFTFIRRLLDRLGIQAQIVRVGEWKSFPEMFTESEPSAENMEAVGAFLDDVYGSLTDDLSRDMGLDDASAVAEAIDRGPFTPEELIDAGFADDSAWPDQVADRLEQEADAGLEWLDAWDAPPPPDGTGRWRARSGVAVLRIDGPIVDGKSTTVPLLGFHTSGDRTLVETLDRLRRDPAVAAVVLAVDSGGGSAVASDNMWRAVMRLRRAKPVVASIGGIAASGGYYVAAAATEIYALPASLTGSIGIFYGKADVGSLLSSIGINSFEEGRGARSTMESWSRPYTEDEIAMLEEKIAYYYGVFLDRIVEGRPGRLGRDQVDAAGRGRIWSGRRAEEIGLVDAIGGLGEAIARARTLAGLPGDAPAFDAEPRRPGLIEAILGAMVSADDEDAEAAADPWTTLLEATDLDGAVRTALPFLALDPATPMALMPWAIEPSVD